jgi:LysM repeat protein
VRCILVLCASVWCVLASLARADGSYAHVVQAGDTLASIAQTYYGDPKRELILASENGLIDPPTELAPGMRVAIPTVHFHTALDGETFRDLALRFYGDAERANVLLRANDKKSGALLDVGQELLVPYPVRHVVKQGESLAMIAEQYYQGRDDQRLFRAFHPGKPRATRGHVVLVPIADLKLSEEGSRRVEQATGARVEMGETRAAQQRIERRIPELREHLSEGHFVEAVALGSELLGSSHLTGFQQISVQRELATAYVALGREDLAITCFRRVLDKQPDLELDSVRTSPRVLKALYAARKQLETDKQSAVQVGAPASAPQPATTQP